MFLVDIMLCPSTLIVFAVMCLIGEVGDGSTPYDTHKRKVVAFVLLLIIGSVTVISLITDCFAD